jgi:hypothetical protein
LEGATRPYLEALDLSEPMPEATYVVFVPKSRRDELRHILTSEDTGPLAWREQRSMFGSEFYFSGPPGLARKAQAYVAEWVIGA